MMNRRQKFAAGHTTPDTKGLPSPKHDQRRGRGRLVMQSVPLSEAELAEVEQLAAEREVPKAELMREWVLNNLSKERLISSQIAFERRTEKVDHLIKLQEPPNRYEQCTHKLRCHPVRLTLRISQ